MPARTAGSLPTTPITAPRCGKQSRRQGNRSSGAFRRRISSRSAMRRRSSSGTAARRRARSACWRWARSSSWSRWGRRGCLLKNKQADFSCGCPKVHPIERPAQAISFGGSAVSRFLSLGKRRRADAGRSCLYGPLRGSRSKSLSTEASGAIPSIPKGSRPAKDAGGILRRRTHTDNDPTF